MDQGVVGGNVTQLLATQRDTTLYIAAQPADVGVFYPGRGDFWGLVKLRQSLQSRVWYIDQFGVDFKGAAAKGGCHGVASGQGIKNGRLPTVRQADQSNLHSKTPFGKETR
jgi:hypothetical protein